MARRPRRRAPSPVPSARRVSAVAGVVLLALSALWLIWLALHQVVGRALPSIPIIGYPPTTTPSAQTPALTAEGITLGNSDQKPSLSQQQALLIAGQLEPEAAAYAKSMTAQYYLLNYTNKATHVNFSNTPVWLIVYAKIPQQVANPSVDPKSQVHTTYDLYVFLDANGGKELLTLQV